MAGSESAPKDDALHDHVAPSQANGVETAPAKEDQMPPIATEGDATVDRDEFGLPIRRKPKKAVEYDMESEDGESPTAAPNDEGSSVPTSVSSERHNGDGSHTPEDIGRDGKAEAPGSPKADAPGEKSDKQEGTHQKHESVATSGEILQGHTGAVSDWSHQVLAPQKVEDDKGTEEDEWQEMPAYAPYDLYNDDGKLIAREANELDEEANAYTGLGGAGKGYTRVQLDDDAKSTTSMEENTDYLFKPKTTHTNMEDEDELRDQMTQLEATKDLLTEGQRIAYVGVTRLSVNQMVKEMEDLKPTKSTKKSLGVASESLKMWGQKMMVRLYSHMEINASEQLMIEQLAEHGVEAGDLTPALMQNARIKNPLLEEKGTEAESLKSPKLDQEGGRPSTSSAFSRDTVEDTDTESLPPYKEREDGQDSVPGTGPPEKLGNRENLDIDIRWTVLCDLFLVLLSDSVYDSRSRVLLEKLGKALQVSWIEICRFEKRVTESLEMKETAEKESWDEADHLEARRKQALRRRYMVMGLATVGGTLVIGLSAGALAPVIGAGLAAGFTTIGVAGTGGFLAGVGGTAIITTGAAVAGGTMGIRASHRRTGAVKTFEYRPLHNNKRVNLIVTVSGWMNGKVDDVRLPFSTVDPVMGDIYSVHWEPEMLQSMGDTINILATEALSQTVQQVLGSTILVALMASLQLPIVLSKLTYLIDNPWSVSMGRANAAGLIFADSLIDRNLGARPITLVGFSLGARVIFAALRELASRGAYGLVQNVFLFGSPIVANRDEYLRARAVVSGRFVNGYASNDWILGYLFRATSGGIMRVAGLAPVEVEGVENQNVTSIVNGHMAYRAAMPKLLRQVGWEVESDEFTEIEEPDPENHDKRQRELIREIDEARKEAEKKPEKRRFGFFKKGKLAQKKGWETYDERSKTEDDFGTAAAEGPGGNILFDIEAIKRELASEQIDVRELESTAPPLKLTMDDFKKPEADRPPPPPSAQLNPYATLRETKSYDETSSPGATPYRSKVNGDTSSQSSLPVGRSSGPGNPFAGGYDEYNLSADAVNGSGSHEGGKLFFDFTSHSSPSSSAASPPLPRLSHDPDSTTILPPPSPLREVQNQSPSHYPFPTTSDHHHHHHQRSPPPYSANAMPVVNGGSGSSAVGLQASPNAAAAAAAGPAHQQHQFDHNAWADEEDDEDFGKEREVTMSFA